MKVTLKRSGRSRLEERYSPQRITAAMRKAGEAVIGYLKRFWKRKDKAEPNQWFNAGSTRTHFWNAIADSVDTKPHLKKGNVTIRVRDTRIRQKIKGGPIVPVRAKALTIPNHPDAHGRTARQLEAHVGLKLFVLQTKWVAYLAAKKGRSVIKYYLLSKGVNQMPWPNAIPAPRLMRRTFVEAIRNYFKLSKLVTVK